MPAPAAQSQAEATLIKQVAGGTAYIGAGKALTINDTATNTVSNTLYNEAFLATKNSATQTYQLPPAAECPGKLVTFICRGASGEILVNPAALDQISIKGLVDHSTNVIPAAGTGVKNTASGNVLGDHLTLMSDGLLTWHEISGAGIWATQ